MLFYSMLTGICGAPRETRTPDPLITNQLLYQLSYEGSGPHHSAKAASASMRIGIVAAERRR